MSEKALRSAVIRLAHAKPELREHLLPLLKNAGMLDGPAGKVLEEYWNTLHDLEHDLEAVIKEYDVAASYRGGPGTRDANLVMDAINKCLTALGKVSSGNSPGSFESVMKAEDRFIKAHGDPGDYADQQSREMFPH